MGDVTDADVDADEELRWRKGDSEERVRERPRCFSGAVESEGVVVGGGWFDGDGVVLRGVVIRGSGMFISV